MLCIGAKAQFSSAPAFPGAEGYGRYTTGGRGGTVYHVTNLNNSGTGSLRAAIEATGPRIVVFDVSGTIDLSSALTIRNANITILGQTAPGQGICVKGYPINVNANNVIIRFIRCRMGDINAQEDDAIGGRGKKNVILDHCSFSWSTDECASFYSNTDFTMQWCYITESLNVSVHGKGAHGFGGIWGGTRASFHHNLLAHHRSRNARIDHDYVSQMYGPIDYVNNVVYNWSGNVAYGGESTGKGGSNYRKINFIGNYYKPGPATKSGWSYIMNLTNKCSNCNSTDPTNVEPAHLYLTGNVLEGNANVTNNNWSGIKPDISCDVTAYKSDVPFTETGYDNNTICAHSAADALDKVLTYGGASFGRDQIDSRIVREVRNGSYTYEGSKGSTGGIIDSQSDVGGWCALSGGTKLADTDGDGMPDEWEELNGLNPNDPEDGKAKTLDTKGYYTNVEVYCNQLVEDIIKAERAGATETFEEYYPAAKYYKTVTIETKVASGDITYPFSQNTSTASGIADYSGQPSATLAGYFDEASADCGEILGWAGVAFADKDGVILAQLTNGNAEAGTMADGSDDSAVSFTLVPVESDDNYQIRITGMNFYAAKNGTDNEATVSATINGTTSVASEAALPRISSGGEIISAAYHCAESGMKPELGGMATIAFKGGAAGKQLGLSDVKFDVDIVKVTTEKIIVDPTGIDDVKVNAQIRKTSHYYNLLGQRVAPTAKGLIIHNGKKVIVK